MKSFTMALALLASSLPMMRAQSIMLGYNVPGTTIKVLNATSDGTLIGPVVDGQQDRKLTPVGGIFKRPYQSLWGINNGPTQVDYEIYACRNEHPVLAGTFYNPPTWSPDKTYLGDLALTPAYLATNPNEDQLGDRVKAIEDLLNSRRELGRKDKINELKDWYKGVKKTGIKVDDQVCGDAQIMHGTIDVSQWYGHRTILITVVGNRTAGYKYTIQ
jgi:hypothetical protein